MGKMCIKTSRDKFSTVLGAKQLRAWEEGLGAMASAVDRFTEGLARSEKPCRKEKPEKKSLASLYQKGEMKLPVCKELQRFHKGRAGRDFSCQ